MFAEEGLTSLDNETLCSLCVAFNNAGTLYSVLGSPAIKSLRFYLARTYRGSILRKRLEVPRVVSQERGGLLVLVKVEVSTPIGVRERQLIKLDVGVRLQQLLCPLDVLSERIKSSHRTPDARLDEAKQRTTIVAADIQKQPRMRGTGKTRQVVKWVGVAGNALEFCSEQSKGFAQGAVV